MEFQLKHPYTDYLHLDVKESKDCYQFVVFNQQGNEIDNFKCKIYIVHNLQLQTPYVGERLWAVQTFRQYGKRSLPEVFK